MMLTTSVRTTLLGFSVYVLALAAGRTYKARPGVPTTTNTCDDVRAVPDALRSADVMRPYGLTSFYQKYTEAYGIPIIGSRLASDDALKRACYLVRFLLADHGPIRHLVFRLGGRFAVMGAGETATDIPEHSGYNPGPPAFGATFVVPASSTAGTNLLCDDKDRYKPESLAIHELGHTLHRLGAEFAIPGWNERLKTSYANAKAAGRWSNTYAMKDEAEYFAEGLQSYFDENWCVPEKAGDGNHNQVCTWKKLQRYDPELLGLVDELFPCHNHLLRRCDASTTREEEQQQQLHMDCVPYTGGIETDQCRDNHPTCLLWALKGECGKNPGYMHSTCAFSCKTCQPA